MNISVKLLESNATIESKIVKALLKDCSKFMNQALNFLQNNIPNIIYDSIINSPEYLSLTKGSLRLELGLPDAAPKIDGLIKVWISNIQYNYVKPTIMNNKIKSSINIYGIKSDFSEVLGTQYAVLVDRARGYTLPWLSWLLLEGSKTIVSNYDVFLGPNPRSRTGLAVMKQSTSGWGISEYAGTESNNWITRAIDKSTPNINDILIKAFK